MGSWVMPQGTCTNANNVIKHHSAGTGSLKGQDLKYTNPLDNILGDALN